MQDLNLESVTSVTNDRINQDKESFEKALDELHDQWRQVEDNPDDNENSNDEK